MRAAVLREPGAGLVIEDVDLAAPRAQEVLVEIEAAGACHSDLHYMNGDLACPLPAVLGHEGAGRIIEVGPGTSTVSVGDRVALLWRPNCGTCRYCRSGNPVMCTIGPLQASTGGLMDGTTRMSTGGEPVHHFLGASCFAERVVVPAQSVVVIPDDIPTPIAAIVGCAVLTGVGAVTNAIGSCAGDPLVIFGAGGVGLSAVMGAAMSGAHPIVVVDMEEAKLERARELGATHTVDARSSDSVEQVNALLPQGARWSIDAVGRPETLRAAVSVLAPGGTAVAVGLGRVGQTFEFPINELVQRQKRIVGSLYGSSNPHLDIPRILDLYRAGRLPLDALIGETFPLERINEAFESMAGGAVGRSIVIPGGSE